MNKKFLSVALFGALLAVSSGTFTSCKDYDDDIDSLSERVDANQATLDAKVKELQNALDVTKQEIASAKKAAEDAQTSAEKAEAAAKEAAATAKAEAIEEAQKLVNELRGSMDQYDEKIAVIEATLNSINGQLDKLATKEQLAAAETALKTQISALESFKAAIEKLNLGTELPEMKSQLSTLLGEMAELKTKVSSNAESISNLKSELSALSTEVSNFQTGLNTLNDLLSQRLTALTFAPSQFINGIEVVNFATLRYTPWNNLLTDKADGKKETSINDGKTTAYYYANPSSVKKSSIKGLTVITNDATNEIKTRSGEKISATIADISATGKVTVNLKKLSEGSFNQVSDKENVEKFAMMAIQAEIALTPEEEQQGISPVVTSDWARLAETSAIPFIHNKEAATEKDADFAHFWNYSTIHDAANATDVCTTEGQFILKHLAYTDNTLNLNSLVEVCDKEGNKYNAADYGLAFEFNLIDYLLKDNAEQSTNQKEFATISEEGVISSRSRNGEALNRDAIGREPLVQVILRNTANKEVVDVRYFKIAWTSERVNKDLGELIATFTPNNKFACNTSYVGIVGTAEMNDKIYTVAKQNGISKEEFHELYKLDGNVYASLDAAKAGTPAVTTLGTIQEVPAAGSVTTFNLQWDIANIQLTKEEYDAGKAVRTVYGRYIRKSDDAETYTFKIVLTLTVDKMAFVAGYIQTYWNTADLTTSNINKAFQVNPALTDDAVYGISKFYDCQLIADMLKGYNKNSGITEVVDLVSNADDAEFQFDEARVKVLLGNEWSVRLNGTILYKNNVKAAEINGSIIRLYEETPSVGAHSFATSAAQELLGKNVPVKLVATNCANITVELDHFLVNFINPLAMTLDEVKESFKDLLTGGSTISVEKIATITETFGLKRTVWADGKEFEPANKLVQWYNVGGVTWDLTNATTNLKKQGESIVISPDVKASKWSDFKDKYVLEATPSEAGAKSLTFKNNSGAHIQQAFQIAVPVYVNTKWSPTLADPEMTIVVLTVNSGETK